MLSFVAFLPILLVMGAASGILAEFPEIDLSRNRVGIYGKLVTLERVLGDHERVEILRPLVADPKDARRKRAGKTLRK